MLPHLSFRTRMLLAGMVLTAIVLVAFVYVEVTQSRNELLAHVRGEAATLIETLNRGSTMTLLATRELEDALLDKLVASARLVDHIGEHLSLDEAVLTRELENSDLDAILVIDARGNIVSAASEHGGSTTRSAKDVQEVVEPVLRGDYEWYALPSVVVPSMRDTLYMLAVEREKGGAIVVGVRSAALLEIRKRLGIGRFVQDIGKNPDITYVALQDMDGILTASNGIDSMSSIADDGFLKSALKSTSASSRIIETDAGMVLEVVKALRFDDSEPILSRIGLSLANVREIQQRSMRRVIFLAGGLFLSIVLVAVFLTTRARLNVLNIEHQRIRSSTDIILDNIADAVVAIDAQGIITAVNTAARSLPAGSGISVGASYDAMFPGDVLLLGETAANGPIDYREITIPGESGSSILAVSTSIVLDSSGRTDLLIAIARDLTEHRRALEQLQRKDKLTAMGELAGGIAHEIRNPLNAIGIIAQRFQHEFAPTEDAEEFRALAKTIRSEVLRVNSIVTQFLEFARPPRPVLAALDLDHLLDETVQTIRSQARAGNIDVVLISEKNTVISGDKSRLQQALLNLLQNSIEAIGRDGMIKCVLCQKDRQAILTIADTGPGITEAVRERMFNLYFTTKPEGTGLGLGIVHQIISEHNGDITVAGQAGIGATFIIRLPLQQNNPA